MPSRTRRGLLRAGGFALVSVIAGCSGDEPAASPDRPSPSPTRRPTETPSSTSGDRAPHLGDFVLWNDDDTPHTLSLTVRRAGTHVLTITRQLDPGASTRVPNPIDRQGRYRITASLETNRRRRLRWQVESCTSVEYVQCFVDGDGTLGLRTLRQTVDPVPTCE